MELGLFLSLRRKKLGISLADVGSILQCTPQAIYRYEKGIVNVDLRLVYSFCKALRLSVDAFFNMDIDASSPFLEEETFDDEAFCSILKRELTIDASLSKEICSSLSISSSRLEKWTKGESFPSVEDFISLAKILGYRPSELYLGKDLRKRLFPSLKKKSKRWFYSSLGAALTVAAVVAIVVPLCLNRNLSEGTVSINDSPRECTIDIQGYDIEDETKIQSLSYCYKVKCGERLKAFSPLSPFYDFVKLSLNRKDFSIDNTPIEKDLELKAYFEKKTFQVSFLGYRNEVLSTSFVKYKSAATPPALVEDQGDFRFAGWKDAFDYVIKNLEIHSYFTRFRTSLYLDFDGGEENGESSKLIEGYTSSSFSSLPTPHKKGHEFICFLDQKGQEFTSSSPLEDEVTSLKAKYRPLEYTLSLGVYSSQRVTFGEEISSLPSQLEDRIVIGWKKGSEEITLPFRYQDDCNVTLEPIFADEYFDYEFVNGSLFIKKVLQWEKPLLDLSSLGNYTVSKVASHAVSGLSSVHSLYFKQETLNLETACFEDLPSLEKVEFPFLTSKSLFAPGIFTNCPNVSYLLTGIPYKTISEPLKLKEYGLVGKESFVVELNERTKSLPLSWNEDFGTIGEFRMGNGLESLDERRLVTKGSKVLCFTPGENSYSSLRLELPHIDQEEMQFHGFSLIRIVGDSFGKVKRFALENGAVSVSNRTSPLTVTEFDARSAFLFPMRTQKVIAEKVSLSDRASEGYFAPLGETLKVDIYGATDLPSEFRERSCFVNPDKTQISYHPEKLYDENEVLDYPFEAMSEW